MIELDSMFFDSAPDDERAYSSAQWSEVFRHLAGNGVVPGEGLEFKVMETDPLSLAVKVCTGVGFIKGRYGKNDTDQQVILQTADANNPRIDRVVLKLDLTSAVRNMFIDVKTGTPSSSPVAPELTRTADIYELSLAKVRVNAGATSVSNSVITDERNNFEVCGFGLPFGYAINQRVFGMPREDVLTRDATTGDVTQIATYFPNQVTGTLRWKEVLTRDTDGNVTKITRTAFADDGITAVYTSTETINRDANGNITGVVVS